MHNQVLHLSTSDSDHRLLRCDGLDQKAMLNNGMDVVGRAVSGSVTSLPNARWSMILVEDISKAQKLNDSS